MLSIKSGKKATEYTYDALNRCVSGTDAAGADMSLEYDALVNPISTTDVLGNKTDFGYDESSLLIAINANGTKESLSKCDIIEEYLL